MKSPAALSFASLYSSVIPVSKSSSYPPLLFLASGSGIRPSLINNYIDQYSVSDSISLFLSTKLYKTVFLSLVILISGLFLANFSNILMTSAALLTAYFF